MSTHSEAAEYLTARNVYSISPEMGMVLVRIATDVKAVREKLAPDSPIQAPLREYEEALDTISIMACYQQACVIGVLKAAMKKTGLR